ncbi:MAG: hypothetical protein AAB504_02605 [Patescibacteria group bacterium]
MKEATLKQAGKVLEVIGETPCEQLQKILSSGLLSDLLSANVDLVDRDVVRQALGLKPIGMHSYLMTIDYDRSVKDGIKAGNYDWRNDDITAKNFPSQETGTAEVSIDILHFGKDISTDEVRAELDKHGYRPATLKELLALGEKHSNLQREFPIIALGSVWQGPHGCRSCPYLYRDGSERCLGLGWVGSWWRGSCRFAAVRK